MSDVPIPSDDAERVAELHALGMMLTEPEEVYDSVTRDLARIFGVPAVFISFIDDAQQHYKAEIGLLPRFAETRTEPREVSVCAYVVGINDMLIVEDLLADERFRDNPVVIESGARFYAGAPLRTDSGRAVGTLCIIDTKPRAFGQREAALLRLVADGVMAQVKLQAASRQLLDRSMQIEHELGQATDVQRFLLPPDNIEACGWRIRHLYRPATHLGGDFVDLVRRGNDQIVVIIADVSGHGTSAALTAMMTKVAFNRDASSDAGPAQILAAMNRDLTGMVTPGQFITALVALLKPASREVTLASAGHQHPLLIDASGVEPLENQNELPLLVKPDAPYTKESTLTLREGQRLLAFTDGAFEAADAERRMLGMDGLARLAREQSTGSGDGFLPALFDAIQAHAGRRPDDDVALVLIEAM